MRPPPAPLPLVAAAAALAVAACTVLLPFELEGLPCDGAGGCAEGYSCVDDICVSGGDAGPCGGCPRGERCDEGSTTCVPDTCDTRGCAVNSECVVGADGRTSCVQLLPPQAGHACSDDSQCSAGQLCFKGAITTAAGFIRTGACFEPCGAGGDCQTPDATCRSFALGLDAGTASLCVPDGRLTGCIDDATCAPRGLTCTVFDHPASAPFGACDAPLPDGGTLGDPCVWGSEPRDAGVLCGNGLCVPRVASAAPPTCSELCDADSCPAGTLCERVELGVEQGFPVRHVPMCVPAATVCADCSSSSEVCGADAPRCTFLGAGPRCLAACTPDSGISDGGEWSECPPGFTCEALSQGARCVPVAGCL